MENSRKVFLMYGEQTTTVSYKVPISKSLEIDLKIRSILEEYKNPQTVIIESKFQKDVTNKMKKIVSKIQKKSLPAEEYDDTTLGSDSFEVTSEISNSKPIVLKELPKEAVPYKKSTKKFYSIAKDVWYSKCYVDRKWEILEFADFESMEKYFENKLNQIKNK